MYSSHPEIPPTHIIERRAGKIISMIQTMVGACVRGDFGEKNKARKYIVISKSPLGWRDFPTKATRIVERFPQCRKPGGRKEGGRFKNCITPMASFHMCTETIPMCPIQRLRPVRPRRNFLNNEMEIIFITGRYGNSARLIYILCGSSRPHFYFDRMRSAGNAIDLMGEVATNSCVRNAIRASECIGHLGSQIDSRANISAAFRSLAKKVPRPRASDILKEAQNSPEENKSPRNISRVSGDMSMCWGDSLRPTEAWYRARYPKKRGLRHRFAGK